MNDMSTHAMNTATHINEVGSLPIAMGTSVIHVGAAGIGMGGCNFGNLVNDLGTHVNEWGAPMIPLGVQWAQSIHRPPRAP